MSEGELGNLVLHDSGGNGVRLGDLWSQRPVALIFLRHYGWPFCVEHVAQLRGARAEIEASGGEAVLVGMGTVERAAAFKREHDLPFRLLVDDERVSYRLAGMDYGTLGQVLGPANLRPAAGALRRGARLRAPRENWHQLGGALVVAPGGGEVWAYRSGKASDNPSPRSLIQALESAGRSRREAGGA